MSRDVGQQEAVTHFTPRINFWSFLRIGANARYRIQQYYDDRVSMAAERGA